MRWYKEIPLFWRRFGFRAMWDVAIRSRIDQSYSRDQAVLDFLRRGFDNEMSLLRKGKTAVETVKSSDLIWVCWLQGEDNMPETIRACFRSLLRNKGGHKVQLITYGNFQDFVDLPEYIIAKHKSGIISNTHFADIIRCFLLWEYGGIWIDAALFVLSEVEYSGMAFSSPKMAHDSRLSINSKWTVGCLASGKCFLLFEFAYKFLLAYWKKYDSPIVYLLLDHVFELAYINSKQIKTVIDSIPLNNVDLHKSRYLFNRKCDIHVYNELVKNNQFLSLTWRIPYCTHDENGQLTYYGHLLKDFDRI